MVWHSKALSKMGLNSKNQVSTLNGMAITEISIFTEKAKRGACPPLPLLGEGSKKNFLV